MDTMALPDDRPTAISVDGRVIHGDCLEVMAAMEPESVDAIVTDPPYGLEFMGKEWDRLGDVGKTSHAGPAERDNTSPYGRTRVSYSGSSNVKCQICGKWKWDHVGRKCECERPDFPSVSRHQGVLMGAWHQQWAEAAYRVAKPSAYLLAFGGTRTVHRMTCALEDAGWIIRDMLVWAYASGFPKSRASLKPAWEPIVMARKPGPLRMLAIDACRIPSTDGFEKAWDKPVSTHAGNVMVGNLSGTTERKWVDLSASKPEGGRWPANVILTDPIFDGGVEGVVGGGDTTSGSRTGQYAGSGSWSGEYGPVDGSIDGDSGTYSRFFSIPRYGPTGTPSGIMGTCQTCGAPIAESRSTTATLPADTAPPPTDTMPSAQLDLDAFDAASPSPSPATATAPSPVATPLDGTLGSTPEATGSPTTNVTATPSLRADGGTTPRTRRSKPRGTSPESAPSSSPAKSPDAASPETATTTTTRDPLTCATCAGRTTSGTTSGSSARRRVPADEPGYTRFLVLPKADRTDREPVLGGLPLRQFDVGDERPSGSSHERLDGRTTPKRANSHPTVKPVDLMRHLVRLVTPPGGLILDPFLGSGTTGLAAEMEGFPWLGIEKEAEYVAIAEARLNGTQRGLGLG